LGEVNYFQKVGGKEIDFILNKELAVEVKETPTQYDLNQLKTKAQALDMKSVILVGRKPPVSGFDEFVWGGSII